MTIEQYEEITGTQVTDATGTEASIKRVQYLLEDMLGYSLDEEESEVNHYFEKGKSQGECIIPSDDSSLLPPDPVEGSYRLFPYNTHDEYLSIDPTVEIHAIKLVVVRPGSKPNGITVKTYNNDQVNVEFTRGVSKYIEICRECLCFCECRDCVQLAIDADWLQPQQDLLFVWAEMVQYDLDCNKGIKRKTIGPHSTEWFESMNPIDSVRIKRILEKYAGPNGSLYFMPV